MAGTVGHSGTKFSDTDGGINSHLQKTANMANYDHEGNVVEEEHEGRRGGRPPPLEIGNSSGAAGPKTPTPGPSSATGTGTVTVTRSKSEREKKIGHRRVTQGGDVTYKKIQTSQIMDSIQLGIQHAIGGLASKPERDLLMQDFMTVEQTIFPSGGSNQTPAHHCSDFRFKTYAPIAFRYFRDLFGIQPDDFLMSMCSVPMRELSNPGASGSIFYLTDDDEFIVKTVQHKECEFLQKLLPGYYMNLNQNPRTLLPKFFGLFNYQCNSKNIRLAVMNNLLPSSVKMHQKYDLKGSTYKRKASKQETQKAYPTFKDLDFMDHHTEGIFLEADTCNALIKTMQRDCRVLESFKIMDYSLLVGIHNLDIAAKEKAERKANTVDSEEEDEGEFTAGVGLSRSKSINRQKLVAHSTALESIQAESEPIDADDDVPPGGIPARNAKGERLLLFLGLIDILQSYRLKKKLEHTFKAMIHDGDTVSVHRPGFYAERFMNFMTKSVFKKIPSLDLPEIKGNHRKFRNLVSTFIALKHSPSKKRSVTGRPRPSGDQADGQDNSIVGSPQNATSPSSQQRSITSPQITSPGSTTTNKSVVQSSVGHGHREPKSVTLVGVGDKDGKDEGGVNQQPVPPQAPVPVYPAVLSKDRPSSVNRSKVPPPVPPRTPKRNGNFSGETTFMSKGISEGSQYTPLPVSTPPPPFQEVAHSRSAAGKQWNLPPSQSPRRQQPGSSSSARPHSPAAYHADSETVSISEVYVETRKDMMFRSSLSVASSSTTSGVSSGHNRMPRSPPTGVHEINRNASATPTWTEGTPSFTESSSSGDLGCPTTPVKGAKDVELEEEDGTAADENENEMV